MRFHAAIAAGVLAAAPAALGAITINGPSASAYWVQATSNEITWSFTAGDPNPISITVTNPNTTFLNGPFFIAEGVDLSNKTFTVTNVTLNVHDGYVVNFVNVTNATQVYAQSGAFSVKPPGTAQVTQSTAAPAATGTSPAGAGNGNGTSSGNGTASGSGAAGSPTAGSNTGAASRAVAGVCASAGLALLAALTTL